MEPDLDDTLIARPRVEPRRGEPDSSDTVLRGPQAPGLVEPNSAAQPAPAVAPPRYFVRFAGGTVIPLEDPLYIGRRPSVPRVPEGTTARLVRVPSPAHEVSATHLELRRVGDTLVASDMRSTNGTIVTLPGSVPHVLIRGASAVVVPGTIIDLGEGNRFEILVDR